ncbi:MAG: hypothetical protein PHP52_00305 [Bacteroidales bacterium]|nr:hypothetical protein [Bacteroidales bacterium]MDD4216697.1 hypothetical protein [Bacteroidales bacterium]MDY0141115.1 hypothetical protein [Bacteroidales bacterium]
MKNIKLITLTIILSSISLIGFSQGKGYQQRFIDDEKIQAEKVAFITEKVNLTVDEAQQFWPVYNEFNEKTSTLFDEERSIHRDIRANCEIISEKDLTTKLDRMVEINQEKAILENEYHQKYKKIIPIQKVAKLYQADKDFRKHLLHKYKGPRGQ